MTSLTVAAANLLPGDEFWFDAPFKHADPASNMPPDFAYKILSEPSYSYNTPLFGDDECIVVAVEYGDGARGSRLYSPSQQITVRRPNNT